MKFWKTNFWKKKYNEKSKYTILDVDFPNNNWISHGSTTFYADVDTQQVEDVFLTVNNIKIMIDSSLFTVRRMGQCCTLPKSNTPLNKKVLATHKKWRASLENDWRGTNEANVCFLLQ